MRRLGYRPREVGLLLFSEVAVEVLKFYLGGGIARLSNAS